MTRDLTELNNDMSIHDAKKKFDEPTIFDIICDVNEIGNYLDFNSSNNKKTEYLPKKGILKHF